MTQVQGFRLSPQQRHVWRLQADSRAFRSQAAVRIEGDLRPEALREALARVVARHHVLHTSFRRSPGIRFPIQVIGEGAPPQWQTLDLAGEDEAAQQAKVDELLRQAARRPFDLERGPLVQASLLTLGPGRHVLLLGLPALCADRRTLSNLVRELGEAYAHGEDGADGADEEELVQYIQFSEWQNELLESDESRSGRSFWQTQDLSPVFKLQLPGEAAVKGGFAPEALALDLGDGAAARLDEVAAGLGASLRGVLLAAWQVLVWRLAGGHDVGTGLLLDGRQHEELAGAMGLFARFLPVRVALSEKLSFAEVVARTEAAVTEIADYQSFYVDEGDAEAGIPACFEYEEAEAPVRADGLSFSFERRFSCVERYRACLFVRRGVGSEGEGRLAAELLHDPKSLPGDLAATLGERFRRLLQGVLADPRAAIGEAEILTEDERRRLIVELNQTAAEIPGEPVHRLFERQAAKTPERAAVELGGSRLTYAELEERANRLARHLISLGAGPDRLVAVYADRSPEMVVALLAALKTGGAYLPLDTAYPPERLAFMIEDARPVAVLTQSQHRERLPAAAQVLCLDTDAERFAGEEATTPEGGATLDSLAYVIYTSGSTGRPKGVMVPHGGLVNYLAWAAREYRVEEGLAVPVHSPIGFDLTVTSLLTPLITGGTVLLLAEERGVEGLGEALRGGPYSLLKVTPAHLALLGQGTETELEGKVGVLIVGGETLLGEYLALWRQRAPSTRIVNEYGPTETVVGCTAYELPPGAELQGPVPIGRPVANTAVYLLDASSQPVPFGVPGELYVGGAGVTRGYLGRPELTAERFVPDPFGGAPGARLYRTGDQARWQPGGDLEFLGRNDHQVKIRGFRLELGEIESVLAAHPGVREAVVLAREDTPGERRLVAYMVTDPDAAPNVDELRLFLLGKLPDYMVPAIFLKLPVLPLTPNGKIDRALLPPPSSQRPDLEKEYVAPRTPLEEQLAEVWSEILGIRTIGVFDSFFALGGDSIRSVRAVALLKEKGLEVAVEDLFRHQTIAELSAFLEQGDVPDPGGVDKEDEDLARLVAELEGLSEEEVQDRLRDRIGVGETGGGA